MTNTNLTVTASDIATANVNETIAVGTAASGAVGYVRRQVGRDGREMFAAWVGTGNRALRSRGFYPSASEALAAVRKNLA